MPKFLLADVNMLIIGSAHNSGNIHSSRSPATNSIAFLPDEIGPQLHGSDGRHGSSDGCCYVVIKYRGQKDAKDQLINKLKTGSSGVWGVVPMPPQSVLQPEDTNRLVTANLALANGTNEVTGKLEGEITLPPRFNTEPGGAGEIPPEAPGYSPSKICIPAK